MILKLYNLNKLRLEQNISLKQQLKGKLHNVDTEIESITNTLNSVGVERFGAIGDFKLLAIHKNTLKHEMTILHSQKITIQNEIFGYDKIIIQFQKEMEKYDYLIKEEKKKKLKELEKYDEDIASEYIQARFIKNMINKKGTNTYA